ncbi:site-specific integrase [Carboxylicivirga mesophila]|uniref:Site-specific integrase n=1 Tax=Carboxylicivirga mesophila TaxID=1166478 RepID=A0ABS5K996_9BACT|nr:site-specific integrase [Carboxylicivirga mesophila]MBS2211432.1 site-specific integrase [Carboxylicivirga mesophila]
MRLISSFVIKKTKAKKDGSCPIYIRVTLNQKRMELSSGIFISPNDWNEVAQKIDPGIEGAKVYNNRLTKMTTNIYDLYNQLVSLGKPFDIHTIKKRYLGISEVPGLLKIFDYYLHTMETNLGKGYAFETLKHYRVSRSKLAEFMSEQLSCKDMPVNVINYDFLNRFDMYLKSTYGIHQNTAWNYHKHLRRVLNLAISMDHIRKNPYSKFKVKLEEAHRDFLTKDELARIETKAIDLERLSIVRDIFVFACYTGLAYADIAKLNKEHLQTRNDGNLWIIIKRTKTKSICHIPLFPNAMHILNKYADYPETLLKGRVLPVSSNQRLNSYLKELADICDIKKNLTMHMARHTFATTVTLSNGVPIETVSKLLGHRSLKVTQIYARVLESKISEDMMVLKTKLGM